MPSIADIISKAMGSTQIGMAAKGLAKGVGAIQGCANPQDVAGPVQKPTHTSGQQVCFVDGSTPMWGTIQEDVQPGQQTVRTLMPNGKIAYMSTDMITDDSACANNK